ncbi:MAG: sulfatase [Lachnospiraceae bacterium]
MSSTKKRPNLLFLFTDEQRADTIHALGNKQIHTPSLDKLSEISTVCSNAYVTQSVCTPSRGSIMTGLYPHTHKTTDNNMILEDTTLCLPEMPGLSEYTTAYYGKWHLGDEVHAQHGFQYWESVDDGYHQYDSDKYDKSRRCGYTNWLVENGIETDTVDCNGFPYHSRQLSVSLPEQYTKAWYVGMMGEKFIKEHSDEPFILYLNFFEPHMPMTGPLNDFYNWENMPLPETHECLPDDVPLKYKLFSETFQKKFPTEEAWKRIICQYYGLVSMVDRQVGRILDTLEACGELDNTILVYTSDHGDMLGNHNLYGKCTMYEEAIKVPLFIRLPGQKEKKTISNPVSQIDLVPTLLEALGAPSYPPCEGSSIFKELSDPDPLVQPEKDVFVEWIGSNNNFDLGAEIGEVSIKEEWLTHNTKAEITEAVRDRVITIISPDGRKLSYSPLGEHQFFNLKSDPGETTNLWGKIPCNDLVQKAEEWSRN